MFRTKIKANEIVVVKRNGKASNYKGFDYYLSKNYFFIEANKVIIHIFPRDAIQRIDVIDDVVFK